ncbi:predicted protein [Chaetoceros tenuissimus]|uniref:MYND-type domain-containing protein n=1 Tax=Chaetoceros tenuissimus TaxID=426638 RepID=A0AAD3H2F5_9STRA|nr:predicted protein [Chaetoceros tenuissimus]
MGKKSKRRTGKQKQKQENVYGNSENVIAPEDNNVEQKMDESSSQNFTDVEDQPQNSSIVEDVEDVDSNLPEEEYHELYLLANHYGQEAARQNHGAWSPPVGGPSNHPYRSVDLKLSIGSDEEISHLDVLLGTEEGKEAFHEFLMWSLSDKADLTPKKFKRLALAKYLMEGNISIDDILSKRIEIFQDADQQIYTFEFQEGIDLVMNGIQFDNLVFKEEFQSELEDILLEGYRDLPVHDYLYDSFQVVVSKFSNQKGICLKDCPFVGLSKLCLDEIIGNMVLSSLSVEDLQDQKKISYVRMIETYYTHQLRTTKEESFGNTIYAQEILVSLFKLFEEMHSCWRCKRWLLKGRGSAETLICASCKCAVYCSQECQVNDWREGKHKRCCEHIGLEWSLYEANKKRVGKALRQERIFTKPLIVNGVEMECFLRPSEKLDYFLCRKDSIENARLASMDAFYENVARLACGGKHPIFGDDTLSLQLQEKMSSEEYEDLFLYFDRGSFAIEEMALTDRDRFTREEISTVLNISQIIKYQIDSYGMNAADRDNLLFHDLSVDQFITIYICYEPLNLHKKFFGYDFDKFKTKQSYCKN